MTKKQILSAVADIHNIISDIKVNGEDVIRMAKAIQASRMLAEEIRQDAIAEEAEALKEQDE